MVVGSELYCAAPLSSGLDYQSHGAKVCQKTFERFIERIQKFRILILTLQTGMRLRDQERVREDCHTLPSLTVDNRSLRSVSAKEALT